MILNTVMDSIIDECNFINHIFTTEYIYKSILLCIKPNYIYHMEALLKSQDFPVEKLTDTNFMNILEKFKQGNLRMLIMSPVCFHVLLSKFSEYISEVNVIMISSHCTSADKLIATNNELQDKKIFSLTK
jgi:hypothetical protein